MPLQAQQRLLMRLWNFFLQFVLEPKLRIIHPQHWLYQNGNEATGLNSIYRSTVSTAQFQCSISLPTLQYWLGEYGIAGRN
jgi:hypothetical protein